MSVTPSVLTPPNHQVMPVTVSASAIDNCDPAPACKIVDITSSEPADEGDMEITGNLTANLVATRNPSGSGRVYVLTVECKDASGNTAVGTLTVTVPKGNGGGGGGRP
jgi:endo-1,4-beta-xylanase